MRREIAVALARFGRSGSARPLRLALRRIVGTGAYDRFRLAVWARARKAANLDPLHADLLPLIARLDRDGRLAPGAARRLRSVARGIRAEIRRG